MRNELQRFKVFLILSVLMLLSSLCFGGDLYIWTDEQGVQHIEDTAPKVGPKDKISVEKYDGENDASSAKGPPDIDKTLPPKAEKEAAEQQAPENAKELEKEQKAKKEKELREKAIEKARQDYEEAKRLESYYQATYRRAQTSRARHLWGKSQQDVEEAKRRLEQLESSQ